MGLWTIILIVLLIVALSSAGYGYTSRPSGGPAPGYVAPMGGLSALLLAVVVILLVLGMLNGFDGWTFGL